nr:uncharacterized protein LOC112581888 [Bubalus bubalis]
MALLIHCDKRLGPRHTRFWGVKGTATPGRPPPLPASGCLLRPAAGVSNSGRPAGTRPGGRPREGGADRRWRGGPTRWENRCRPGHPGPGPRPEGAGWAGRGRREGSVHGNRGAARPPPRSPVPAAPRPPPPSLAGLAPAGRRRRSCHPRGGVPGGPARCGAGPAGEGPRQPPGGPRRLRGGPAGGGRGEPGDPRAPRRPAAAGEKAGAYLTRLGARSIPLGRRRRRRRRTQPSRPAGDNDVPPSGHRRRRLRVSAAPAAPRRAARGRAKAAPRTRRRRRRPGAVAQEARRAANGPGGRGRGRRPKCRGRGLARASLERRGGRGSDALIGGAGLRARRGCAEVLPQRPQGGRGGPRAPPASARRAPCLARAGGTRPRGDTWVPPTLKRQGSWRDSPQPSDPAFKDAGASGGPSDFSSRVPASGEFSTRAPEEADPQPPPRPGPSHHGIISAPSRAPSLGAARPALVPEGQIQPLIGCLHREAE